MHCNKEAVDVAYLLNRIKQQQKERRKHIFQCDMCTKCKYRRKHR